MRIVGAFGKDVGAFGEDCWCFWYGLLCFCDEEMMNVMPQRATTRDFVITC